MISLMTFIQFPCIYKTIEKISLIPSFHSFVDKISDYNAFSKGNCNFKCFHEIKKYKTTAISYSLNKMVKVKVVT